MSAFFFFFQAEDGIRDAQESRGLGDVYKRQVLVVEWADKEKLGFKLHRNSYQIHTIVKQVAKSKFGMAREFRWLISVDGKSVFSAPMKETKQRLRNNVGPLRLEFTTKEEYDRLQPADYLEEVPQEAMSVEEEFEKDILKATERLDKMREAEKALLEKEAESFNIRVTRLKEFAQQPLPELEDSEIFEPTDQDSSRQEPSDTGEETFGWSIGNGDGWEFPPEQNTVLEEAYQSGQEMVVVAHYEVRFGETLTCTNTEIQKEVPIHRKPRLVSGKEAEAASMQENLLTLQAVTGDSQPKEVLLALLKHHPDGKNLDAVMNTLFAPEFNPLLWIQRDQQAEETVPSLAGLPRSQVVEEWVCWCGSLEPMAKNKCKVCQQSRLPDAKIVARRASPSEVIARLNDKVTPYKEAIQEARQLCCLLQAPAVVWEYVPPGQNKWQTFSKDDIAKIERWCKEGGEPNIEVRLNSHGSYIVDMEQLRMQKKNPGMGFQGGNTIHPVRRRDMRSRLRQLFDAADLTQTKASELLATLQDRFDKITEQVEARAAEPATAAPDMR
eukprot:TRINITY_DN14706_c0_g1_i3.p1 TRINITY_DN14706_c0_g1~~TRINITY_DN14706_c0_g1_i3.p1  ORF type:complete len:554 (+),score=173.70 TRINITY_DN14706_c0_g1_i3:54-1715(+)